jgi:predicted small lipoprotein YifL
MNGSRKGLILLLMALTVVAGCARKPEELPLSEENAHRSDVLISHLREQWKGDLGAERGTGRYT